mmetsp:Transcript_16352/g.40995  ORF Transcript_16352/g.40995 Transcript_16352/m.40995 type:complete len:358 (-) Transcript_16352:153-1226(-)
MTAEETSGVPEPDKIISYGSKSNSALYLYGDASSSKIALLCAGYADDHIVFQPFAKALSEQGIFVGVMCIPGFDDRVEAPWTTHNPDGYTFDEMVLSVREAAKILRNSSTCNEKAEFIGIFHDWGCCLGGMWASRLEEEAKDATEPDPTKPDKIVFFDVLLQPSPNAKNVPSKDELVPPTMKAALARNIYLYILASAFLLQRHVSRMLAPFLVIPAFIVLGIAGLAPTYDFDVKSIGPLYGDKKPGVQRICYMAYPYWKLFKYAFTEGDPRAVEVLLSHHADWKTMPVLYLYGTKKPCMFHELTTLKMLEREETEGRSISKAVAVEEAGHFLYVQKPDECLKHVLEFVQAENTFLTS